MCALSSMCVYTCVCVCTQCVDRSKDNLWECVCVHVCIQVCASLYGLYVCIRHVGQRTTVGVCVYICVYKCVHLCMVYVYACDT